MYALPSNLIDLTFDNLKKVFGQQRLHGRKIQSSVCGSGYALFLGELNCIGDVVELANDLEVFAQQRC